jgi:N6-L-threonylcarbamoyladenine synthase
MLILSIETSCDETAAAVTRDGREVLSSEVYSQIALHAVYGGVVPEIASRKHIETIAQTVSDAVSKAGIAKTELDAVAVTTAPGLIGALLTGLGFAKAAAYALGIPLIPVHHIKGHIAANYIAFPELVPPFTCLVASGGHTMFIDVTDYDMISVLGSTRDDAAGEAFDKVARVLGFPYPGGKELDALARTVPDDVPLYALPRPSFQDAPLDCSFSGLKTAVINMVNSTAQKDKSGDAFALLDRAVLAKSTAVAVAEMLAQRAITAAKLKNRTKIALAGGVAANSFLRGELKRLCAENGFKPFIPPQSLCGDNAAMVGCAGYYAFLGGARAPLSQNAFATMSPDLSF